MQTVDHNKAKRIISSNVSRLLEETGMTQAELARATGDNEMYISRIRHGVSEPTSSGLARLAKALGVTTDELLTDFKKIQKIA